MAHKSAQKKVDLRRYPFRGIVSEIAAECGVNRAAVSIGLKRRNTKYSKLFLVKYREALALKEEMDHVL